MRWKGQQLPAHAEGLSYLLNAGLTKTDGVEVSMNYGRDGLSVGASVNYVRARLATDLPADVQDGGTPGLAGDRIPSTPRWAYALQGEYEFNSDGRVSPYLQGNLSYRGSSYSSFRLGDADVGRINRHEKLPSYALLGVKAGVRINDNLDLNIFADNLTNEYAVQFIRHTSGTDVIGVAQPRTIGVNAQFSF